MENQEKKSLLCPEDRFFLYLSLKNEGKTHEEAMIEVNKQMPSNQMGVQYVSVHSKTNANQ